MEKYCQVLKLVAPKRVALKKADENLQGQMAALKAKMAESAQVEAQVAALKKQLNESQTEEHVLMTSMQV